MIENPAGPVAMPSPGDEPRGSSPILVAFAGPDRQRRVTVLFRAFMLIPHWIVLWAVSIAAGVVAFLGWFGALFMGHLPEFAADFLAGYLRWMARVMAYGMLLADEYPPFSMDDADYPVQVALRPGRLNRFAVFFRLILAIPAWILALLLSYGMGTWVVLIPTWLIVLIGGRMPKPLHQALSAVIRYVIRYYGYMLLLTGAYPRGAFGDRPDADGLTPAPCAPAAPGVPAGTYGSYPPGVPGAPYGPDAAGTPADDAADTPSGEAAGTPAWPGGPVPPGEPGWPGTTAGDPYVVAGAPGVWPGAVARWPRATMPWRLVLSSGAKWLTACILVLGVLAVASTAYEMVSAINSLTKKLSTTVTAAEAINKVGAAYTPLRQATASFETRTTACHNSAQPLRCLTATDRYMADSIAAFGSKLRTIPMPAGPATAADAKLEAATSQAAQDFRIVASAKTISQYQAMLSYPQFGQAMNRFDQDYNNLLNALTKSLGNQRLRRPSMTVPDRVDPGRRL